jgi:hypothetical protein
MMQKRNLSRLVCLGLVSAAILQSQNQVDLKTQSKDVDFTAAPFTKPIQTGVILPSTCSLGGVFFLTTGSPGANLWACTSVNVWSLQGGQSGFATGSGAPSGACVLGATYYDTTNGNTWLCESPGNWQMALTTPGAGPFVLTGQNGTTPATPSAGFTALFFSSTAKAGQSLDDAGSLGTMVRPTDCSSSGQVLQKIGSDATVSCVTALAPVTFVFPAGAGSSSSPQAGGWWEDGASTVVCPAGTPYQCYLHWNSGGSILAITTVVPHARTTGTVSVALTYQGNGSGNTVQPAVSTGCVSNGSTGFAFNSAQNFPAQVTSGTNYYIATLPSATMTGCSAGSMLVLQFSRADSGGFLNLAGASITFNLP